MARLRTQKSVSKRIDLSYFKHAHPLRTGRKLAAFIALVLTIVGVTFLQVSGDSVLHNPGALTQAHAFIQHDCRACHDGGGKDGSTGLSKGVSDASCLNCHDAAMHHPNVKPETLTKWPGIQTTSTDGKAVETRLTSKDCVSCHTEHRGHDLLVGNNPQLCVSCHADLPANSAKPPVTAAKATEFTVANHPRFGRELMKDGKWFDPTVIKFNHAKHNSLAALKDNCTACHSPDEPQMVTRAPGINVVPPYTDAKDAPAAWNNNEPKAYMAPVSYSKHCVGCHEITLPGKVALTVPHEELAVIRTWLAGLDGAYTEKLNAMPDKAAQLTIAPPRPRPGQRAQPPRVITESEWVNLQLAELLTAADKSAGRDPKYAAIKKAITPPAPPAPPATTPTTGPATAPAAAAAAVATGPNPNLLEHFVTFGIGANCNYCHEVAGDVPAIAPTNPARTVPTLIPQTPRKWFANSKFDHNAHRSVSCLDCHDKAANSSATSDILSPDIDQGAASCVSCHKPDTTSLTQGTVRGAPMDCVTCHGFHDQSFERTLDGSFDVKTGKRLKHHDGSITTRPSK
jgi:predicted CXXCH cytochrome family protein